MIILRIHHVICMQSFIGKGYSQEFINNFSQIMHIMNSNPTGKCISLVNHCDDICKYCPNKLNNNKCKNEVLVNHLDNAYQSICNFDYTIQYSIDDISNIIKNTLTISKFNNICKTCQWFGICSKLIKNII